MTSCRRFHYGPFSSTAIVQERAPEPGHDRQPLVICLHGFPDNAASFRHQLPALAAAGYQVVCPLLPGYEPSSQDPAGHYDLDRVSDRLIALIHQIRIKLGQPGVPVHLIGHDWGALAGFAVACKAPVLLRSFTSISIPYNLSLTGLLSRAQAYLPYSWYIQLFQLPRLPEYLLARKHGVFIDQLIQRWSPGWQMPKASLDSIKATLAQPGVHKAALAYYRAIPGLSPAAYRARALLNGRILVPTLMIEGAQDGCIHADLWRLHDESSFPAGVKKVVVQAGHFPHQERVDEVNAALLGHL